MDMQTAKTLNELNTRFYAENAESFSETRQGEWPGWRRLLPYVDTAGDVLDVACGNMRFERFLARDREGGALSFRCVDSCAALARPGEAIAFEREDVIASLLDGRMPAFAADGHAFDLVVSFGFLHHVPGSSARRKLMEALVGCARPGGIVAVSLWHFMQDERLARKARRATSLAVQELGVQLEPHDYILGWQDKPHAWRYCHDFEPSEVDSLIEHIGPRARVIDRYQADGHAGNLNTYVVLQRRAT